ncbi:unnamed protein product [Merluccius merluccius]
MLPLQLFPMAGSSLPPKHFSSNPFSPSLHYPSPGDDTDTNPLSPRCSSSSLPHSPGDDTKHPSPRCSCSFHSI